MKLQKGLNTQRKASWLGASLGFLMMSAAAYGATVLSDIPVASESVTPPTIVFTADDSGSMLRTYTPEAIPKIEGGCPTPTDSQGTCVTDIQDAVSGDPADIFQKGQPPMLAAAFNGLAYNPAVEYRPPMKGDGTSYPNQTNYSYVGWPSDLDNWGTGKPQPVNLKDKKYSYKKSVLEGLAKIYNFTIPSGYDDGTNYNLPPHYFVASFKWCSSSLSTNCVDEYDTQHQVPQYSKGKFELVVLDFKSGMISDELTNYANWVAYYRSRAAASKTVASLAFNDAVCHLGDKDCEAAALPYVTYMSINNTSPATPARFSGADRTAFSKTLLSTTIKGGTPLTRVANEVGQLFRNSNTYIRNSCHRNYHIMFTDGLWNTWSTTVGDVDGAKVPQSFPVASLETPYGTLIPGKDWPNPIRDTHKNDSTLSDIALYYWMTDLRPNEPNNVLPTTADPATWQHLNFVGMGFGVRGTLTAQDVENIKNGISGYQWPSIPTGSMTTASVDYIQTVDDLWHASFNGFGKYVATDSPDIFGNELYSILRGILTMGSTRTGLSLTSPLIAKGDVYSYSASFTSATEGEIVKKSMDAEGKEGPEIAKATDYFKNAGKFNFVNRKVYTFNGSNAVNFTWDNLSTTQKTTLSTDYDEQKKIVDFLRGDRSHENARNGFRVREGTVLGDIVNSKPVIVTQPLCGKDDKNNIKCALNQEANPGYGDFYKNNENRKTMIYVGANDGMLHAFDDDLNEQWAYIPSALFRERDTGGIVNLIARDPDRKQQFKHYFYVDATPRYFDVQFADESWHSVLVGGLGKGGAMYYAVDVTHDGNTLLTAQEREPKFLWEFTDKDLGYTFGRPILAKTKASGSEFKTSGGRQKWVAIFPSGYNNSDESSRYDEKATSGLNKGDGKGYLYFVDIENQGQLLYKMPLGASDAGTRNAPTNLVYIAGFVQNMNNQLVTAVYGADEKGNLWRFDLESEDVTQWKAEIIGKLMDADGKAQYVTTEPTVSVASGKRYVIVGTGGFRNKEDLTALSPKHTFYVFPDGNAEVSRKSEVSGSGLTPIDPRNGQPANIKMKKIEEGDVASSNGLLTDGWYMDMSNLYHLNVAPVALSGAVVFAANKYTGGGNGGYLPNNECSTSVFTGKLFARDIATGKTLFKSKESYVEVTRGVASIAIAIGADNKPEVITKGYETKVQPLGLDIDLPLAGGDADPVPERVNIRYISKQ